MISLIKRQRSRTFVSRAEIDCGAKSRIEMLEKFRTLSVVKRCKPHPGWRRWGAKPMSGRPAQNPKNPDSFIPFRSPLRACNCWCWKNSITSMLNSQKGWLLCAFIQSILFVHGSHFPPNASQASPTWPTRSWPAISAALIPCSLTCSTPNRLSFISNSRI